MQYTESMIIHSLWIMAVVLWLVWVAVGLTVAVSGEDDSVEGWDNGRTLP